MTMDEKEWRAEGRKQSEESWKKLQQESDKQQKARREKFKEDNNKKWESMSFEDKEKWLKNNSFIDND